jgi:hypothetical protein
MITTSIEPTYKEFVQWFDEALRLYGVNDYGELTLENFPCMDFGHVTHDACKMAYRAAADEQLRLCIKWLCDNGWAKAADELQPAMRPEPPRSLKQQALRDLDGMVEAMRITWGFEPAYPDTIKQALESLPDA